MISKLLTPEQHDKLRRIAAERGISVNELHAELVRTALVGIPDPKPLDGLWRLYLFRADAPKGGVDDHYVTRALPSFEKARNAIGERLVTLWREATEDTIEELPDRVHAVHEGSRRIFRARVSWTPFGTPLIHWEGQ